MDEIVGEYHAVWLLLPVERGAVQELLPSADVPGVHLQPRRRIPIAGLPEGAHPVLLEVGKERDCGPAGFGGLFRSSFHECKLEIPFVAHPQHPGESLCYKALVVVDRLLNALGSERLFGLRTVRASFRSSFAAPSLGGSAHEEEDIIGAIGGTVAEAATVGTDEVTADTAMAADHCDAKARKREGKEAEAYGEEEEEGEEEARREERGTAGDSVHVEMEGEELELHVAPAEGHEEYKAARELAGILEVYTAAMAQRWFGSARPKGLTSRQAPESVASLLASEEGAADGDDGALAAAAVLSPRWGREGTAEPIPNPVRVSKGRKRGKATAEELSSPRLPSSLSSSFIYRVDLKSVAGAPKDAGDDSTEDEEGDGWSTDSAAYDSDDADQEEDQEEEGEEEGQQQQQQQRQQEHQQEKEEKEQEAKEVRGRASKTEAAEAVVTGRATAVPAHGAASPPSAESEEDADIRASIARFHEHVDGQKDKLLDLCCSAHVYDLEQMRVRPVSGTLQFSQGFWSGSEHLFAHIRGQGLQVFESDHVSGDEKEPIAEEEASSPQGSRRKASFFARMFRKEAKVPPPRFHVRFSALSEEFPFGAVQVLAPFTIERSPAT